MSDESGRPVGGDGSLLRLHCPFCRAETPLWFRADSDDTISPAEWERWLDTPCAECGRTPREQKRGQ